MDGGAWWAAIHGVAKSRTRLSDFTFIFHFHALETSSSTKLFSTFFVLLALGPRDTGQRGKSAHPSPEELAVRQTWGPVGQRRVQCATVVGGCAREGC